MLFGLIDLGHTYHIAGRPLELNLYYFVFVIFCLGFWLIYRTIHSPFGQVLKAIRENEPRAISLGYKVERFKLLAFVLSAALAGTAGATKSLVFQLASLTDVNWHTSGEVVLMTLLGGMGTVLGPVVGAFTVVDSAFRAEFHRLLGNGGDRRHLRRLRPRLPSRFHRRTGKAPEAPPLAEKAFPPAVPCGPPAERRSSGSSQNNILGGGFFPIPTTRRPDPPHFLRALRIFNIPAPESPPVQGLSAGIRMLQPGANPKSPATGLPPNQLPSTEILPIKKSFLILKQQNN